MKLQDDPRLTAYALGELEGEESARFATEIAIAPGATDEIEDIRRVAGILSRELGGQQETDYKSDRADMKKRNVVWIASRIRRWGIFTAAACVVLSVGVSVFVPSFYRIKGRRHGSRAKSIEESMSIHGQAKAPAETEQPASPLVANATISKTTPASAPTAHPDADLWSIVRANNPTPKQFIAPSSTDQLAVRIPQSRGRNIDLGGVGRNRQDGSSALPATESLVTAEEAAIPFHHLNREGDGLSKLGGDVFGLSPFPFASVPADERGSRRLIKLDGQLDPSQAKSIISQMQSNRVYGRRAEEKLKFEDSEGDGFPDHNAESYDAVQDNPFLIVDQKNALSTFSIDVDTASYSNIRRMLQSGQRPPKGAVRIEEMINYFPYDYPPPTDGRPFSVNVEIAQCPWQPEHRLARVGLRGKTFAEQERPACNLVFLIDVSGSMQPANKLPLLKQAMGMLVNKLTEKDRVAMVVYAGTSGMVLDSTRGDDHATIVAALERLEAGGSTNGAGGIELAYKIAAEHKIDGGANRVILATDGDFNVGITNQSDLVDLIEQKARSGVFLSVLGVGMGNYKDSTLEKLADKGNGNYAYIDTLAEARKVLVDQVGGTLVTIAKDVKIQIEFNPAMVKAYRLIGYENRILAAEDFNNDKKDAGEIGAGHTVTALYELVPVGGHIDTPSVDPLKYQPQNQKVAEAADPDQGLEGTIRKIEENDIDGAKREFMSASRLPGKNEKLKLAQGLFYLKVGQPMEAIPLLQDYNHTPEGSQDHRGQAALGRMYRDSKMYNVAISYLNAAKRVAPTGLVNGKNVKADLCLDLALCYRGIHKDEQAHQEEKDAEKLGGVNAQNVANTTLSPSGETMTVKLRYKQPDGDTSSLIEQPIVDGGLAFSSASADTRFAAAVAAFGMLLRDSPYKGSATYALVSDLAGGATVNDVGGYRAEFQMLVQRAGQLPPSGPRP